MNRLMRVIAIFALAVLSLAHVYDHETSHRTTASNTPVSVVRTADQGTAGAAQAAQQTPEEFYHQVWQLAQDNFLWQDRLQDWSKWEHKFDGTLKTQADAERAVNQMLGSLNDPYTYFKDSSVTASRGTAAQRKNVVEYKMLPDDIGYIRIRTFGSVNTSDEVEAALKALPNAKAYIIDLRDNGGGYVWQAFRTFALFVDKGTFTTMKGMSGGKAYSEELEVTATKLVDRENGTESLSARPSNLAGSKPIVILVNGDTASASEMITGALRDNGRAKVVGVQSFGKGIAQNTWDLQGKTSVQITFAQYYFPSGGSIHKVGIRPDSVVARGIGATDNQLNEAVRIAKDELKP